MTTIDQLVENSNSYREQHPGRALPSRPARKIAVVACMDARIDVYRVLGLEEGDAHVIRNGGGVVTDDVIRSLMLSQRLLGTEEIAVIQHTGCGLQTFNDDELRDQIHREVGERPPFPLAAFADLDASVRDSIERVRRSPFLPHRDQVRGFVLDVGSGALREIEAD